MSSHRPYLELNFHDSVQAERAYQDAKWGLHNQSHAHPEWLAILTEEIGEVSEEVVELIWPSGGEDAKRLHLERLRAELIQVAAVASKWVDDIDRVACPGLARAA